MAILVTGATGVVGRRVVERLVAAGEEVRALSRRPATGLPPSVEVVAGDLLDPRDEWFAGVDRLYLFPAGDGAVAARAARCGVRRVVDLSAAAVTVGLHVNPVEAAVEASGAEWTHVRPAGFMANVLPVWAPAIRAARVVRHPFPDEASVPVHEDDIAAVAVAALLEDGHAGRAYTLTGPELITNRQQVAAISAALGEEVRFEVVSRETAREEMRALGGFAAEHADLLLGFVNYDGGESSGGDVPDDDYSALLTPWPDVEQALGRPARSYARWARDHVADFR
ncbi:NAD(P)H-binding protein [Actinosynnema sp. NPDC050436]|uniref:NAD(P)H-binding protein n=1 Tax=Actinosynnema sp. NPDC050436 TaxID=3155659 RepID=UPI0033CCDF36